MRVGFLLFLLLLTGSPLLAMAADDGGDGRKLTDLAIRYVNHDVITLGDVKERFVERMQERWRRDQTAPRNRDEELKFANDLFEELTDESLLLQYAKELNIHIDDERVAAMVLENARTSGRNLSLQDQSRERKRIERRETISAVLGFFDGRTPGVSPSELWDDYQRRKDEFRRPARAKIMQIVMRPTDDADREALRKAKVALFQRLQDAPDQTVKELALKRLDEYLAGDAAVQERLLGEVVQALVAMADQPDLGAQSVALVKEAVALAKQQAAVRDAEQTFQALTKLRQELVGKGADAFAEAARKHSQAVVEQLTDLHWNEPGQHTPAIDQQIFGRKSGELSPVFWSDKVACLVLVVEAEAATQRSFPEVSAEIDASLRQRRLEQIRAQALALLRGKASISPLMDINEVFARLR